MNEPSNRLQRIEERVGDGSAAAIHADVLYLLATVKSLHKELALTQARVTQLLEERA